jgi:hypothetical protein
MVGGMNVHWHPCLLAEITPHDGPPPTGDHVWDDNNLSQKNISIVNADAGSDFAFAIVIGHEQNSSEYLLLEVDRGSLPREVQLYVDLVDPILRRRIRQYAGGPPTPSEGPERRPHNGAAVRTGSAAAVLTAPAVRYARQTSLVPPAVQIRRQGWYLGSLEGREVVFLHARGRPQVPIYGNPGGLDTLIVGGIVGPKAIPGEYEVILLQRTPSGEICGSATLALTVGKVKAPLVTAEAKPARAKARRG